MLAAEPLVIELDYHPDTPARFEPLSAAPWSVLLDSGFPRRATGRYDIFAAEPLATIRSFGERSLVATPAGEHESREDPFSLVAGLVPAAAATDPRLPFLGGAIGYFGYDLARRLERLPGTAVADNRLPDMAIGIYGRAVVTDHATRRSWLVDAAGDEAARRRWLRLIRRAERPPATAVSPGFEVLSAVEHAISQEAYAAAFDRIKQHIRDGDCYQVNLAQRFHAPAQGNTWHAYRWLRQLNPAPFGAYLRVPEGAVLSSSPERFLQLRDGLVQARPIKGTRARGAIAAHDAALARALAESPKDRAENVMIVDLLRNDLGRVCETGTVRVPELFAIESYATVHHLVSTVEGRLQAGRSALDLLRACFPGGSITGAPKVRAMQIIDTLESHRRGVYCGSIGYVSQCGTMDTNIGIRTLTADGERMLCWAGGGIVHDSRVGAEYQESLDKAAAMLALFRRTESRYVGAKAGR